MAHSGSKTTVGLLSLKWNNYKSIFFETIKTLREKSKYTDATLAVDGHFYHVHKLVMSTCSDYFSDIFEKTPCKAPIIVLKDVSKDEIEGLLSYMYLGEVNVHHNKLASFLKTAESLRIKGLAVSDDEPTNLSKSPHSKKDTPSLKKRRLENTASSPAVPPVKSLKKFDTPLAMKVEMSEGDDRERRNRTKINYDEDPGSDQDSGDAYEPHSPVTEQEDLEHDMPDNDGENNASTSFFGTALQQSGEVQWRDKGNASTSLQKQGVNKRVGKSDGGGDDDDDDAAIILQLNEKLRQSPPLSQMSYKPFRSFMATMMQIIKGGRRNIGYTIFKHKPTWWPSTVPWVRPDSHELDDLQLIVRTAYHHYGIHDIDKHIGGDVFKIQTVSAVDVQNVDLTQGGDIETELTETL